MALGIYEERPAESICRYGATIARVAMKRILPGALAICLAASLWGLDGVVLTPRLHNLPVPFVVLILHLVPFILMQPFLSGCYRALRQLSVQAWVTLGLVALTGGIVGTFSMVRALFLVDFNQLSVVVLLQKLQPVFAISLAAILLDEPVTRRFSAWTTIALGGAYLLTFGLELPTLSSEAHTMEAAAWALLAAAAFGSATVFGKRLLSSLDFKAATFGRYGLTVLLMMIYLGLSGKGLVFWEITPSNWLVILLIGLTTGSGALFLYYYGLSRVPATVSAICELCLPLSAIILDYFINGSVLSAWQWVGALVLVIAILRVSYQPSRDVLQPKSA
jgi:drug/metabolite transporter (DMT)-like permease